MAAETRDTKSQSADHASAAATPSEMSAWAAGAQAAATVVSASAFLGPVSALAADAALFGALALAAAQPAAVRTRKDESRGSPESLVPPKHSLVMSPDAPGRQQVEREGGVTAASPLRYGTKAMKIGLNIDPTYLEEIKNDIAKPTGGTKVDLTHLNAWLAIPDVVLLVNPTSLEWSMANRVQETRTRGGFLQEFWGSELDTLTASGKSAVAYVASQGADQGGGLTIRDLRRDSAGYRNLRRLVDIYRSNGVIYGMRAMGNYAVGRDEEKPAYRKTLLYGGYVDIFYDGVTYSGFFENFEVRESGEAPFWLDWSFTFKVETVTGQDLKVYDSGKYLRADSPAESAPAEFSSMSINDTGQRNL